MMKGVEELNQAPVMFTLIAGVCALPNSTLGKFIFRTINLCPERFPNQVLLINVTLDKEVKSEDLPRQNHDAILFQSCYSMATCRLVCRFAIRRGLRYVTPCVDAHTGSKSCLRPCKVQDAVA